MYSKCIFNVLRISQEPEKVRMDPFIFLLLLAGIYVRVCVCVRACTTEREREGERIKWAGFKETNL